MGEVDTFGAYVRARLDQWGDEFSLARDCDYLGHQSKNMLQVLIDHRGEMPGRTTGFKPLEVDMLAMQVETIVSDIAIAGRRDLACVLRAYYCGQGRRKVERWETANLLLTNAGFRMIQQRKYMLMHAEGFAEVRGRMIAMCRQPLTSMHLQA